MVIKQHSSLVWLLSGVIVGSGLFVVSRASLLAEDPDPAKDASANSVATNPKSAKKSLQWTGWLGPHRNGAVTDVTPPKAWPQSLKKSWQHNVGTGYGTPLVVDQAVFQHARIGNDEVLWRLDLKTGKVRWRKAMETPFKMGGGGERHGKGPKSCPVYADGRVFTLSITGRLTAWDAETGETLWTSRASNSFSKSHPYWGVSTSPIVEQDKLIVHLGTDGDGALFAFDTKSGRTLWREGTDGASYSSPLVTTIGNSRQIVEWNHHVVTGIDVATGQRLWSFPLPHTGSDQNMPTPTIHDGLVIVGAENRGIRCLAPTRDDEGEWNVELVWHQKELALDMSSAVMNDGLLYGFSHYRRGQIFCLDPKTGEIHWRGPGRAGRNVTFLSLPGFVIALMDNGELKVLAATPQAYKETASYRVSEQTTWAPPVMLGDGFLIKDTNTLVRWTFPNQAENISAKPKGS